MCGVFPYNVVRNDGTGGNQPEHRMRIFVSADIEGVAGISSWEEAGTDQTEYAYFKEQMTREVVAACEGAVAAGASEILVKDAHGTGRNLVPTNFPECVRFSRGWSGHPFSMMDEIDRSYDAALMIGYHSRAGSGGSPLAHTWSSSVIGLMELNGAPVSEFTINAMTAQYVGVPTVFVSGDELLSDDIKRWNDAIVTVVTQRGHGRSTVSVHPAVATREIREGVERALRRDVGACRKALPEHFRLSIEYKLPSTAYARSFYPGARLEDDRRVVLETDDYFEVLRFIGFAV
jgi:D-amino peptidase